MPIFQDDLGGDRNTPPGNISAFPMSNSPASEKILSRKVSEESIRTEFCEGPLLDSFEDQGSSSAMELSTSFDSSDHATSNRNELIERLKRGESPTWMPKRDLSSLLPDQQPYTPRKSHPDSLHTSPLLPSPKISQSAGVITLGVDRVQTGQGIERPRSALHSGDFTEGPRQNSTSDRKVASNTSPAYNSTQEWLATSPPRGFSPFQLDPRFTSVDRLERARSRAPSASSSLSSSFMMMAPTSPLVQSESNEDIDITSSTDPIDISRSFHRNPRRHTLQSSHSVHSPSSPRPTSQRPLPHLRRDGTNPYQAHQPRRSLTSNPNSNTSSLPQTPMLLGSRRPSLSSDVSPLHASMVGSYEESILRGRMSTTPSKPLDFVAQIGVLGLGNCKSNLRCPPHVTVPFPAVFYSYETTSHGRAGKPEDGPSPYVGQIDLENNLSNPDEGRVRRAKRIVSDTARTYIDDVDMTGQANTDQLLERGSSKATKTQRGSTSLRAPPGGSYRIPEKGQLQIIIKNPNKTAVKLFLVPYDLTGMEPGSKTFVRQRSYSAGPISEAQLSSSSKTTSPHAVDRPILRYLVHLHICSPSRGRYYLYKSIRVVFANRVPDGKEKLRNEISLPEPRFSNYKPGRDSNIGISLQHGAGANLAAEKAYRRRSSGFGLSFPQRAYDNMDGVTQALEKGFSNGPAYPYGREQTTLPVQPIPFSLNQKSAYNESGCDAYSSNHSPTSSQSSRQPTSQCSEMSWTSSGGVGLYEKLHKGDAGYGGNVFTGSPDGRLAGEGLLARKLKDLGVDHPE